MGFHLNIQWLTSMAIYFVQLNVAQELTCHNSHLSLDVFVHMEFYIDPMTACAILQGGCKYNFGQITKCSLLHIYFVQKGHCINDTSRRLRDHISWWNLFLHMPCQSRFVGFLIVQLARKYDSILIDVLALHCMHKKHLLCTFAYHWMFWILALLFYLGISSPFVLSCPRSSRTSLNAADAVRKQTSSKGFMQGNGFTQLFSNIFLSIPGDSRSTWTIQDVWTWTICLRFQRQTFQYSTVMQYLLTAQALRLNPFVPLCVSLFAISSLVWSTRILTNGFDYLPIKSFVCNVQINVYHSLFVCLKKPAALPWCTNESKHYINHMNLTHPQSWQIPSYIPLEVQVNTVGVLYPNTKLLDQKVI